MGRSNFCASICYVCFHNTLHYNWRFFNSKVHLDYYLLYKNGDDETSSDEGVDSHYIAT